MLHKSTISAKALELLIQLQELPLLQNFYLAGGTGLALRLGHRISVDLDFFTPMEFDTNELGSQIPPEKNFTILANSRNSITFDINGVKTEFIRLDYPLLKPVTEIEGVKIASLEDIAAMKINSVINRGSKKDFFDIAELLHSFSMKEIISFHTEKYQHFTMLIVLKSLIYFEDAEIEPDPISVNNTTWEHVKSSLQKEINQIQEEFN